MSDRQSSFLATEAVALETRGPDPVPVSLSVNGVTHALQFEPRVSLLVAQPRSSRVWRAPRRAATRAPAARARSGWTGDGSWRA
jgi:hypothetical protein